MDERQRGWLREWQRAQRRGNLIQWWASLSDEERDAVREAWDAEWEAMVQRLREFVEEMKATLERFVKWWNENMREVVKGSDGKIE